jgi:hypothetical protein
MDGPLQWAQATDQAVALLEGTQKALATNEASEMGHGALYSRSGSVHSGGVNSLAPWARGYF